MSKFGWDLPPGVRHSDIPGNRPEDVACEQAYENVTSLIPTEFDDLAMLTAKIKKAVDGGADLNDIQSALIELVNFADTHSMDLGDLAAGIEEAGTWSPPEEEYEPPDDYDYE